MKYVVGKIDNHVLLREFLQNTVMLSKRLIKRIKAHDGGICVNGEEKTVRYVLKTGDIVTIQFPKEAVSDALRAEEGPLSILYEDDYLLIINKQAGTPTIPSHVHPNGTIANYVLHYYEEQNIPFTIHVVTRLDRDTSGLILIAKHQYSHSLFSRLQGENGITRKYKLVVSGLLAKQRGIIREPIGRKQGSIIERMVTHKGKKAITHFNVLDVFKNYSLIEAQLETGRTHQIRVHFSYLGHPLLGDDLYGGKLGKINRQALHCSELAFIHPFTGEAMQFTSQLPADMMALLASED